MQVEIQVSRQGVSWWGAMNFALEQLGRAGERAGQLELGSRLFATPLPLLSTRGGTLPHLTQETLQYLENSGTY